MAFTNTLVLPDFKNSLLDLASVDQDVIKTQTGRAQVNALNMANDYTAAVQPAQVNLLLQGLQNMAPAPAPSGPAPGAPAPVPAPAAAPPQDAPAGSFEQRMGASEGVTNPRAVNGSGYSGQFQFGTGRLTDLGVYLPAQGENPNGNKWAGTFNIPGFADVKTHADFLANPRAQRAVFGQHVADIDRAIWETPGAEQMNRDGLRAVAHLGGIGGMQKYVQSGGQYNPADSNGTSLADYYKKFSAGGTPALAQSFGHADGPLSRPVVVGDSLAAGIKGANKLDGDGVVGAGPQAILDRIGQMHPQEVFGRPVILSGGASNNPQAVALVEQQAAALKAKGAGEVRIVGVSDGRFPGVNDQLRAIAQRVGGTFVPVTAVGPDGVHPADYKGLGLQAPVRVAAAAGPATDAPRPLIPNQNALLSAAPPPTPPGPPQGQPAPAGPSPQSAQSDDAAKTYVRRLMAEKLYYAALPKGAGARAAASIQTALDNIAGPGGGFAPDGSIIRVPGSYETRFAAANAGEAGKSGPAAALHLQNSGVDTAADAARAAEKARIDRETHAQNTRVDQQSALDKPTLVSPGTTMTTPRTVGVGTGASDRPGTYTAPKDMPAALQEMDQGDITAIQTGAGIKADLGALRTQIESGKLQLGPYQNWISRGRNVAGLSDENSRNFASFDANMMRLQNDSLRLNKGVQTEGDAQRAWKELITGINDPDVVKQRLTEIESLNERAVQLRGQELNRRRSQNGADPIDLGTLTRQQPVVGQGGATLDLPTVMQEGRSLPDHTKLQDGQRYKLPNGHVARFDGKRMTFVGE